MSDKILTKKEAYLAMHSFLESYYEMTQSDEIGGLLGSMSLLEDGNPADAAYIDDWDLAVKKVLNKEYDAYLKIQN